MTDILKGSCLCGAVTFEITGAVSGFYLCHCSRCRKDTGSAHAANLFSTDAELTWLSGADSVQSYKLPGTRHAKSFCANCGSSLPRVQDDGRLIVPAGSLDTPVPVRPNAHIFVADRADWDDGLHTIAHFDALPDS